MNKTNFNSNCCNNKEEEGENRAEKKNSKVKGNNNCPTSFCQSFEKNSGIITDNEYEIKSELKENNINSIE